MMLSRYWKTAILLWPSESCLVAVVRLCVRACPFSADIDQLCKQAYIGAVPRLIDSSPPPVCAFDITPNLDFPVMIT